MSVLRKSPGHFGDTLPAKWLASGAKWLPGSRFRRKWLVSSRFAGKVPPKWLGAMPLYRQTAAKVA